MKLVHLPTEVDAVLWDDSSDTRAELVTLGYAHDNGDFQYVNDGAPEGSRSLIVPTQEGDRVALPGDYWIILGVEHHWYAIRNRVKAGSYIESTSKLGRLLRLLWEAVT